MKLTLTRRVVAIAAGLILAATSAHAGVRVVNCDEGDSLQNAIDAGAGSAKVIEIELYGTCEEDIRINRDGVAIVGDGATVIDGDVRLYNADGTVFEDLNLTGSGLRVVHSRARLRFVNIFGNEGYGVSVLQNGMLVCINCRIEYNTAEGVVLDNGSARLRNTIVEHNGGNGIMVTNNGFLRLEGGGVADNGVHGVQATVSSALSIDGSIVSDNDAYGVFLDLASSGTISNTVIQENSGEGLEAVANSAVTISGGSIGSNGHHGVSLIFHSTARLADVEIFDNNGSGVYLDLDSGLMIDPGTDIPPNATGWAVECADQESSAIISNYANVVAVNCTDF